MTLVIQREGHLHYHEKKRHRVKNFHKFWIFIDYNTENHQATTIFETVSSHLSTKTVKTPPLKVRLSKRVSTYY
jgi:hypothetical protein